MNIRWRQPFPVVGNHLSKIQSYFFSYRPIHLLPETVHILKVFVTSVLTRNRCSYFDLLVDLFQFLFVSGYLSEDASSTCGLMRYLQNWAFVIWKLESNFVFKKFQFLNNIFKNFNYHNSQSKQSSCSIVLLK